MTKDLNVRTQGTIVTSCVYFRKDKLQKSTDQGKFAKEVKFYNSLEVPHKVYTCGIYCTGDY